MNRHFTFGVIFLAILGMGGGCEKTHKPSAPVAIAPPAREKQPKKGQPVFVLKVEPDVVRVLQGGKAKIHVTVERKGYDGPITLDLDHLPHKVTAPKGLIAKGKNEGDLEIQAQNDAEPIKNSEVLLRGTSHHTRKALIANKMLSVRVIQGSEITAPFDIKVESGLVELNQGEKTTFRVVAFRKPTYQGPIAVELRDAPARVTAAKVVIPPGQNTAQVELTAAANSPAGMREVRVAGTAVDKSFPPALSDPFTLKIGSAAQAEPWFELSVDVPMVEIKPGQKVRVPVMVSRKGKFNGSITVRLRDLPDKVMAAPIVISPSHNAGELELQASPQAPFGSQRSAAAVGMAMVDGSPRQYSSPPFRIVVKK